MGNTISSPHTQFSTSSSYFSNHPFLVVERRNQTLFYGPVFVELEQALAYVAAQRIYDKRVAIDQGQASWTGQALELVHPGSQCLAQEKQRHPENFVQRNSPYHPDYYESWRSPRVFLSKGLLPLRERAANFAWEYEERQRLFQGR